MNCPKINLIISTYAGKYNSENKENILKLNLQILNKLNPLIDTITIMKPKINEYHEEIIGYYDITNINLDNIKNKIKIIECENIGISYGQFFTGIYNDLSFDYYILIEDDYVIFRKNFTEEFIEEFLKNENDSLLCSFIYKYRLWDIVEQQILYCTNKNNTKILKEKIEYYNLIHTKCNIPDFSLCILSKNTINKIINKFSLNHIIDIFNINFSKIWLHQILFGHIIYTCGIKIYDIKNSHLNIFYETPIKDILLCNFEDEYNVRTWNQIEYKNEKFKSPLFIPIQILNNNYFYNKLNDMKRYMIDENDFFENYNRINFI